VASKMYSPEPQDRAELNTWRTNPLDGAVDLSSNSHPDCGRNVVEWK